MLDEDTSSNFTCFLTSRIDWFAKALDHNQRDVDRYDTDTCTRSAYNMLDCNMPIIHAVNYLNQIVSGHIFCDPIINHHN